jgi:ATP-dependent exoDNAse (exonuclease V) beta subunit
MPHTVAPGTFALSTEHRAPSTEHGAPSTYSVTWWDPGALHLGAAPPFGLRRDDLIVKTGDLFGADERLADYERWRDSKAAVVARASAPGVRFITATAWAAKAAELGIDTVLAEQASAITILEIPGAANRPRGPRFGSLVHAVLATAPLDADADLIARTARIHARLLNAGADEIRGAVEVVSAVLRHDLVARARASASVKRETPVSWVQRDGTLVEGVLDLAFDEGEGTVVVDFKTDHELAAGESRYRAQLLQYVTAVSRATGRPASGVLFRV